MNLPGTPRGPLDPGRPLSPSKPGEPGKPEVTFAVEYTEMDSFRFLLVCREMNNYN